MEDSLAKEMNSIRQSSIIRPQTTGFINSTNKNHLDPHRSHLVSSLVTPSNDTGALIRPHAPAPRLKYDEDTSAATSNHRRIQSNIDHNQGNLSPKKSYSTTTLRRNDSTELKTKNISELWANLNRSNLNLGRLSHDITNSEETDIHFLNIDKSKKLSPKRPGNRNNKMESTTTTTNNKNNDNDNSLFTKKNEPYVTRQGKIKHAPVASFQIPELPTGKVLKFNILSTWGDPHFLGLMGIEIFDSNGKIVKLDDINNQIWANPANINVLPEYDNDPRTVDNLVDGVNHTCDDLHAWLTPYTVGQDHLVYIDFDKRVSIAMIRIWNYNKSRIHSYRGARYIEITLDNNTIFKGEIKRAAGSPSIKEVSNCHECILFTRSSFILSAIEANDPYAKNVINEPKEVVSYRNKKQENALALAQLYADEDSDDEGNNSRNIPEKQLKFAFGVNMTQKEYMSSSAQASLHTPRPTTGVGRNRGGEKALERPTTASLAKLSKPIKGRVIEICIITNWGDPDYVGLCGLACVNEDLQDFTLFAPTVSVGLTYDGGVTIKKSKYLNNEDANNVNVLVNNTNMTTSKSSMWLTSTKYIKNNRILILNFDLKYERLIKGIRIWNYNAGHEESCIGVKHVNIFIDGSLYNRSVVRKAPGESKFDYNQLLPLNLVPIQETGQHSMKETNILDLTENYSDNGDNISFVECKVHPSTSNTICEVVQQYETPVNPTGCMFKLLIQSNHGDGYYVGLNGITLYDRYGIPITIDKDQLQATPYRDINDLPEVQARGHDARCLENLVLSPNDTYEDSYMWLAPLTRSTEEKNSIFILFDEPVTISVIKIWNYSKTPSRGAKEIELYIDDVLVFKGSLHKLPTKNELNNSSYSDMQWGATDDLDLSQSILFTNDHDLIDREYHRIPIVEEAIEFIDEGKCVQEITPIAVMNKDDNTFARPMTAIARRKN